MFRKHSLSGFILLIFAMLNLSGCGGGGGNADAKTGLTAPTVTDHSPVASSVSVAALITATFSAPMNASSIPSSFTLKDSANTNTTGTVSYADNTNTATFTPSVNLVQSTPYTVTISTAVQDKNGIPMVSPYNWTFTTGALPDLTPPVVKSTNPADISKDVALNATISAVFSEAMKASTIATTGNFTLKDSANNNITGRVSYTGITATFAPAINLAYITTYTATITNGVTDLAGNAMTNTKTWAFTTTPWTGTRQLGIVGKNTSGYSVATDASGNVYVAGDTNGGLDTNALTGTTDFFVTKYNSTGVKQYTRQLGVAGVNTNGYSVATDASGNVYVAGRTNGGLDTNALSGFTDFFVTKYDSTGVKQYTRQLGVAAANTYGNSVATDPSGNIYVAGYTDGGLDGNPLTGTQDFFVTKYDSTGVRQYTRQLGVAGCSTVGNSVATDASGNVYVAGYTSCGLDTNALTGSQDFFVTKYNSTGVRQYTRQLGVAAALTSGYSVATDASGNVYVAGYTSGGLDTNALTGTTDFFVTKYNSTGVRQYTRQLGVAAHGTVGMSVAIDISGNINVAGYTNGGLDGNKLTGPQDFFVTKYNSSGVR